MPSRNDKRPQRAPPSRGVWPIAFPPVLLASILLVYRPSLFGPFYFDDGAAIEKNHSIRSILGSWRPPMHTAVAGRPVVNVSFALSYAWSGMDPRGYRVANVAIHSLCALLLWWIVRRTLRLPGTREKFGTSAEALAAAVALLWAVHPLLADAVAYVTQRTELLVSLFYLLTLACAIKFWDATSAPAAALSRMFWIILATLACAAGMASKEVMLSAPLAVLLYDRAFVSCGFRAAWSRSRGLYIPLACTWILLIALAAPGGRSQSAGLDLGISSWTYLLTQSGVVSEYLKLCFWPAPLSIAHRVPWVHSLNPVMPQALLVLALMGACLWALIHRPQAAFPAACFFLILAPTSSFLPIISEIMAERRMYLPLACVISALVPAAWLGLRRIEWRGIPFLASAMIMLAAIVLGAQTRAQATQYGDGLLIWDHAIRVDPLNETAHNNRGLELYLRKDYDAALASFERAVASEPRSAMGHFNIGAVHMARGRLREASDSFAQAARIAPRAPDARQQLARTLLLQGRIPEAAEAYVGALQLQPDWIDGLNELAWIRATSPIDSLRNGPQAVKLATRACELGARKDAAHLDTLGAALAETGDFSQAIRTLDQAIERAQAAGQSDLLSQMLARREQFRSRKPYRDAEAGAGPTSE